MDARLRYAPLVNVASSLNQESTPWTESSASESYAAESASSSAAGQHSPPFAASGLTDLRHEDGHISTWLADFPVIAVALKLCILRAGHAETVLKCFRLRIEWLVLLLLVGLDVYSMVNAGYQVKAVLRWELDSFSRFAFLLWIFASGFVIAVTIPVSYYVSFRYLREPLFERMLASAFPDMQAVASFRTYVNRVGWVLSLTTSLGLVSLYISRFTLLQARSDLVAEGVWVIVLELLFQTLSILVGSGNLLIFAVMCRLLRQHALNFINRIRSASFASAEMFMNEFAQLCEFVSHHAGYFSVLLVVELIMVSLFTVSLMIWLYSDAFRLVMDQLSPTDQLSILLLYIYLTAWCLLWGVLALFSVARINDCQIEIKRELVRRQCFNSVRRAAIFRQMTEFPMGFAVLGVNLSTQLTLRIALTVLIAFFPLLFRLL